MCAYYALNEMFDIDIVIKLKVTNLKAMCVH